jgi:hypothetical protein
VDDVEIAASTKSKEKLITFLDKKFIVKDFGEMSHLLGMKICQLHDKNMIHISQPALIEKLVKTANLENAGAQRLPLTPGLELTKEMAPVNPAEAEKMARVPYRTTIGILLYIAPGSRPDVMFAVTKLSHCSNPGPRHWKAATHLIRYLIGTNEYCRQSQNFLLIVMPIMHLIYGYPSY